jgi:hypothetical protein
VLLHGAHASTAVTFAWPENPLRPLAITPLDGPGMPVIRATPDLDRPHRLVLNGTSAPMAFLCGRCGRDCLGQLPSPWAPLPQWQCLGPDGADAGTELPLSRSKGMD